MISQYGPICVIYHKEGAQQIDTLDSDPDRVVVMFYVSCIINKQQIYTLDSDRDRVVVMFYVSCNINKQPKWKMKVSDIFNVMASAVIKITQVYMSIFS